jgi:regulator of sirC expression with transglutaminase-like and TPR domain
VPPSPRFAELARTPDPPLDALALGLAAEFREVDAAAATATLDTLGAELAGLLAARPASATESTAAEARACAALLGATHGFTGERDDYDHPDNSMLDLVLERRRGLPIVLSVVYVAVARRAGVALEGVGLAGHFVVGHFGAAPPLLLDPFGGGEPIAAEAADPALVRPWHAHEIALRMLNNLVGSYARRGDLRAAIHAARMRLDLPAGDALRDSLRGELRALQARLN